MQIEDRTDLLWTSPPNLLTLLRILLVPVLVALLAMRTPWGDGMAMAVFIVASITDYFDGYLARKKQMVSVYGKLMDPLADKFLVVSALIMLQELHRVSAYIVILLICRELAITGLRAVASAEGMVLSASKSAKWKTAMQMTAIPMLIYKERLLGLPIFDIGQALLLISLIISLGSAQLYVREFFAALKNRKKNKSKKQV